MLFFRKMLLFDTHTHDYFDSFDEDRDEILTHHERMGVVGKVQIGCDEKTSYLSLELAKKYSSFFCTLGIHPCHVQDLEHFDEDLETVFQTFSKWIQENPEKIVGMGETGFDFFHEDTSTLREKQEKSFQKHLDFCLQHDKTLVVHCRNAKQETINFFRKQKQLPKKTVIHCFSEDFETAKIFTEEMGFFLGIGGILTYPKNEALRETISQIPLSFLITETDAPFLAPQKHRGKRNESIFLIEVVETIANVQKISVEEAEKILLSNAKNAFGIEKNFRSSD